MRHRIAALAGAGVMIAALGAVATAASAGTARSALGRTASSLDCELFIHASHYGTVDRCRVK